MYKLKKTYASFSLIMGNSGVISTSFGKITVYLDRVRPDKESNDEVFVHLILEFDSPITIPDKK